MVKIETERLLLHPISDEEMQKIIDDEKNPEMQNAPTPVTSYALFHDREYVTNEQMNDKRFLKHYSIM